MNDAAVWVPVPAMFYWGWLVPLIFGTIFGWRYHRDKVRLGNGIWFSLFFYSFLTMLAITILGSNIHWLIIISGTLFVLLILLIGNLVIFYLGFLFYNYLTMLTIYQFNWPRLRQDYIIVLGDGWAETQSKTTLQNMQFSKQLIAQGPVKNPRTIFVTNNYDKNNWSFIDKSEPIIGKDCSIIEVK